MFGFFLPLCFFPIPVFIRISFFNSLVLRVSLVSSIVKTDPCVAVRRYSRVRTLVVSRRGKEKGDERPKILEGKFNRKEKIFCNGYKRPVIV